MQKQANFDTGKICKRLTKAAVRSVGSGFLLKSKAPAAGKNPGGMALNEKAADYLRHQLERERRKAKSGSPRYDFNRHLSLLHQLKAISHPKSKTPTLRPACAQKQDQIISS